MLRFLIVVLTLLLASVSAVAEPVTVTMYKNPQCGCCEEYAKYLRQHGFKVTVTPTHNMSLISRQNGVPEKLAGCHTMMISGYVTTGREYLEENPTKSVAIAAAAGLVAGCLLTWAVRRR